MKTILNKDGYFGKTTPFYFLLLIGIVFSCTLEMEPEEVNSNIDPGEDWLIEKQFIYEGGPGKDGIPSIDHPTFIPPEEAGIMLDDDLVLAISFGDSIKIYPHIILNWHEIVNDQLDDYYFSLMYCPLTASGGAWNRKIKGNITEFGISGYLYNNNMIPYDRRTDSNWSQLRNDCVNGALLFNEIEHFNVFETNWGNIKSLDKLLVLDPNTGFDKNYRLNPYPDYDTKNDYLLFPLTNSDDRLENKEIVYLVYGKKESKAYHLNNFGTHQVNLITDRIESQDILVVGSQEKNFMTAFEIPAGNSYLPVQNEFPIILQDNSGNRYDIFGIVKEGPNLGEQLVQPDSYKTYWFAAASFFPRVQTF